MSFKPIRFIKKIFETKSSKTKYPSDFEDFHISIIEKVKPYTMTSPERIYALIESVKYIVKNNINGDFVECGVWKGGSMMAIAETLIKLGVNDRNLWLYDTFTGMTDPTNADKAHDNQLASDLLIKDANIKTESIIWAYSTIEEVKKNIALTNYPLSKINYIEGDVLKTIPIFSPLNIALLRLDTDWYESTKHELEHFFPILTQQGVLIIDDYGYWKGSKKAVDEYFEEKRIIMLLSRIDDTGRSAIKLK